MQNDGLHYNWRHIDGYNAPVTVVMSQRGLGKTFGKVGDSMQEFAEKRNRFIYVVETLEEVKVLSQNKGEKFFAKLKEYFEKQPSNRKQKIYRELFENDKAEVEDGETDLEAVRKEKVLGGTIKIGEETAGYLIASNSFSQLKRNNFVKVHNIIIDEFIPEQIDIRHLQAPRKLASIIQSVARTENVRIYMMANTVRLDDILLTRLGIANMKLGEIRKIKDEHGLLLVAHYVDPSQYAKFTEEASKSVSGRFSALLGEDYLEKNEFRNQVDDSLLIGDKPKRSHLLFCLHGEGESVRINVTQDYTTYYVLSDYGKNVRQRICLEEKFCSNVIHFRPEWKEVLMLKFTSGAMKFESPVIYLLFKTLLKLDINA